MKYSWYRIIDVHVVGYAKERTIHFGPDSIDSANTILTLRTSRGIYEKDSILESGFTVGETWDYLEKAWVESRASQKVENNKDKKLYASIIQRLKKELKIQVNDFSELGLCACNLEEANTYENQHEEEDSRLAIVDPWTNEKIQEAKDDEDDQSEFDFDSL